MSNRHNMNIGKYIFTEYAGANWVLIFRHDIVEKVQFFNTDVEYIDYYDENNTNIYSIIGEASHWNMKTNYYEFLLEYPPNEGFNHWRQNNYPLYETSSGYPEEYYNISTTWTRYDFGGLFFG